MSWYWPVMQNLNKLWLVASKMAWSICWTFTRTLKNLKDCTSMGPFCLKIIPKKFDLKNFDVWPKKLQRSYVS